MVNAFLIKAFRSFFLMLFIFHLIVFLHWQLDVLDLIPMFAAHIRHVDWGQKRQEKQREVRRRSYRINNLSRVSVLLNLWDLTRIRNWKWESFRGSGIKSRLAHALNVSRTVSAKSQTQRLILFGNKAANYDLIHSFSFFRSRSRSHLARFGSQLGKFIWANIPIIHFARESERENGGESFRFRACHSGTWRPITTSEQL